MDIIIKNRDIQSNLKRIKAKHIIVGLILFFGLILLNHKTLYPKILSLIFGDSLYLPFYRVQGVWILITILITILLVLMRKSIWKPVHIFLWSIVIFFGFFLIKNITGDWTYIVKDKYLTMECEISDIEVNIHFGGRNYPPYQQAEIFKEVDGKYQYIQVPFPIYAELSKEPKHKKILVYYLPHTGSFLKYEFVKQ